MAPNTTQDIINKVRRITGKTSAAQITDAQIVDYINTFYIYDFPEHLRLESLRVNYQFVTTGNVGTYDFPKELYLTTMPPVYIGGYQSYMTQSRDNFFRVNPYLNFLQQQVSSGTGDTGGYSFTLSATPITPGFKPNPSNQSPNYYNWMVLITAEGTPDGTSGISPWYSLIDNGAGTLYSPNDTSLTPTPRGTINYITGAVSINATGFEGIIPSGNTINAQYVPYQPSRPQSALFFQDQILLYPIPDQAYTVSFEAYKYPFDLSSSDLTQSPQLKEWWQLLAYGAADKIFADNADMENMQKFRPLLDEQMRLCQRRTIVQMTSERTPSIYTEQSQLQQYPFGNVFSGI